MSAAQPGAAEAEHGQQVVGEVRARRAVAQQQFHSVGPLDTQPIELIDVCRELHERRHPSATCELAVLHDPAPCLIARQEVGEPDELLRCEGGLVDDVGIGGQRGVGAGDGLGEGGGIRRPRLSDLDDALAVVSAILGEHPQFVLAAEASRALERGVFGFFDGVDASEPGVDGAQPRELALRSRLEVARAPDDARLIRDVSQWFPFVSPIVRAGGDSRARASNGLWTGARSNAGTGGSDGGATDPRSPVASADPCSRS